MLASIFSINVLQSALELGCIYALVALALFLSYSILNIADLSTDGCFTLGCAVCCQVAVAGHPVLALFAAMAAGGLFGLLSRFLQARRGGGRRRRRERPRAAGGGEEAPAGRKSPAENKDLSENNRDTQ